MRSKRLIKKKEKVIMTIVNLLEKTEDISVLSRFNYYKKLGYTNEVSFVLSVFTYSPQDYGYFSRDFAYNTLSTSPDRILSYLIHDFSENVLRPTKNYEISFIGWIYDTLENFYEKHSNRIYTLEGLWDCFYEEHTIKTDNQTMRGFNAGNPIGGARCVVSNVIRKVTQSHGLNKECSFMPQGVELDAVDMMFEEADFGDDFDTPDFSTAPFIRNSFDSVGDVGLFGGMGLGQSVPIGMGEYPNANKDYLENLATDSYEKIEEKGFEDTLTSPTSTFRMTNNTASVGIVFNSLRNHRELQKNQVRIEELLNYFKYDLSVPTKRMFNINTELCSKPNSNNKLLFIGVQGKRHIPKEQNIVVLLDVSGSMQNNNTITQLSVATVVSKLNIGNKFSLITYSTDDDIICDGFEIKSEKDKIAILDRLLLITIGGCTNGSVGIETAYRIGEEHFIEEGNNHVILITDGDLNFGITSKGGLETLIEEKKQTGLFLSVLGTGLYNYKDDKLEALSKHGNGTYAVVNSLSDIETSLYDNYESFMNAIAKDVKAQVEFNPYFVKRYRLIGYENRRLNHNDFKDDTVISEPFGSGGYGIALYELVMQDQPGVVKSDLKYQKAVLDNNTDIATVKVRYKELLEDTSNELSVVVKHEKPEMTENLTLAYMIYILSEKLRGSRYIDENDALIAEFLSVQYKFDKLLDLNGDNLNLLLQLYDLDDLYLSYIFGDFGKNGQSDVVGDIIDDTF